MANKENSNFKQAFGELLSGKIATEESSAKPAADVSAVTETINDIMNNTGFDDNSGSEETVIGKSVVIEGSVRTTAKLVIKGEITGNVVSSADLVVTGKVGGSIEGNNITLNRCEINDTVTAVSEVQVSPNSVINGDVKSGSIVCEGTINGNVNADSVSLLATSKTVGDITCKKIRISEGASLKGKLETI